MRNREYTSSQVTKNARRLRSTMTPAEVQLWQRLRGKQMLGLRFRRQEPLGNFIADFYCAAARLVIELDGSSHDGRVEYDTRRDDFLNAEGHAVLRFRNQDVMSNMNGVLEIIEAHCPPFARL